MAMGGVCRQRKDAWSSIKIILKAQNAQTQSGHVAGDRKGTYMDKSGRKSRPELLAEVLGVIELCGQGRITNSRYFETM